MKRTKSYLCLGICLLMLVCTFPVANATEGSVPKMVEIPAGTLQRFPDKANFEIETFYLSTTEITNLHWNSVCKWAAENGYDLTVKEGDA